MTRIHVLNILDLESDIEIFWANLSNSERDAADRFVRYRDKLSFVVTRAGLRNILARELQIDPSEIAFKHGEKGKPYLADKFESETQFNASHSHDLALIAVNEKHDVGVDIEYIRTIRKLDILARRYFTDSEYSEFESSSDREASFFAIWTLKEAIVKLTGQGIVGGLDWFDVTLLGERSSQLRASRREELDIAQTGLCSLEIKKEYKAAFATDSANSDFELVAVTPKAILKAS